MNRNHQLDFFRGFFLILILVDHYLTWDNLVMKFTSEFIGWVSAAEAFVFLSGLTAGLVYTYKLTEKGEEYIVVAAKKRAWDIYKYHIILLLFTIAVLYSSSTMWRYWDSTYEAIIQEPVVAASLGGLLLYQPLYLDILPMYAIFLLFVPLVIKSFQKGNIWQIIALSFTLYLIGTLNLLPAVFNTNFTGEHLELGYFNLLSWQFLFMIGLLLGFLSYHNKIEHLKQNTTLLLVAIMLGTSLFYLKLTDASFNGFDLNYWAEKGNLRPLRILNFASIFFIVSFISFKFQNWFKSPSICYLGRHSLEVFSFHIILIILFRPLGGYLNSLYKIKLNPSTSIYPYGTLFLLLLIPALYLAPMIKNKKVWVKRKATV